MTRGGVGERSQQGWAGMDEGGRKGSGWHGGDRGFLISDLIYMEASPK